MFIDKRLAGPPARMDLTGENYLRPCITALSRASDRLPNPSTALAEAIAEKSATDRTRSTG